MFKRTTEELIAFIETSQYTDIIFDFDETIVHLLVDWSELNQKRLDLAEKLNHIKLLKEMGNYRFEEFLIEKYGPDMKEELDQYSLEVETDHLHGKKENDMLITFIREKYKKYNFYIVSSNMKQTITTIIQALDLEECFHSIVGRNDVAFLKPNPEGIEKTIKNQNRKKENFLMVGDNPISDGEAAERAGVDSFIIDMYL